MVESEPQILLDNSPHEFPGHNVPVDLDARSRASSGTASWRTVATSVRKSAHDIMIQVSDKAAVDGMTDPDNGECSCVRFEEQGSLVQSLVIVAGKYNLPIEGSVLSGCAPLKSE
jgi:hypothetical protein